MTKFVQGITLRQELKQHVRNNDRKSMLSLLRTMEATRDAVAEAMEEENDKGLYSMDKRTKINQANQNIALINQSINLTKKPGQTS